MQDEPFQSMTEVEQPPAACLMLRRSILMPLSLFDEQFPIFITMWTCADGYTITDIGYSCCRKPR